MFHNAHPYIHKHCNNSLQYERQYTWLLSSSMLQSWFTLELFTKNDEMLNPLAYTFDYVHTILEYTLCSDYFRLS